MGCQLTTVESRALGSLPDHSPARTKNRLKWVPVSAPQALRIRLHALAGALATGAASYVVLRVLQALYGRR
jgi:hypothetical protein